MTGGAELRVVLGPQVDHPVGLGNVGQGRSVAEQGAGAPTGRCGDRGLAAGQPSPGLVEQQRGPPGPDRRAPSRAWSETVPRPFPSGGSR